MPSPVFPAQANQSFGYFPLDSNADALFENNKIGLADLPANNEAFISRDGEGATPWLSIFAENGDFTASVACNISGTGPIASLFSQNLTGSSSFYCHGNIADVEGHTFRSITDVFSIEATVSHSSITTPLWKLDTVSGVQGALYLWSDSASDYAHIYAEGGGLFVVQPGSPDEELVTNSDLVAYAQPLDVGLTAYSGLVTAADKGLYFTAVDTPATFDLTAFGRSLLDDANAAAVLATLALDADLATFALPANTTISVFGATLVDDADAATARTTLGVDNLVTQGTTHTVTNSAVLENTQIIFVVPAGNSCWFSMVLFFDCTNAANDPKYRLTCSAPPTVGRFKRAHLAGITASQAQDVVDNDVVLGFNSPGWGSAELNGYIENSTGGDITVTLQIAENVAGLGTSISLFKGSYCKYKVV